MGESDLHRKLMTDLIFALQGFLSHRRAYVAGNLFIYYEEGSPKKCICPDVFVVLGATPGDRLSYQVWNEGGLLPNLVIELTSKKTKKADKTDKPVTYASLGISEYILFDPWGDYLRPRLQGYRLVNGAYQPMEEIPFRSEALNLEFREESSTLRLYDARTGLRLPFPEDEIVARRAAERRADAEARRAEEEARRAEEEARRAEEEARRAEEAEAEAARLREELRRLKGEI